MITCRQLLELDIFRNVKLKAGRKGLDREVSWVYAKHTKSITPWVRGGEFILVSGYEYGTDENELLELIDEAYENNSAGILVEGGINFKELPVSVMKKADEKRVPLFFAHGVISFVDITHDVTDMIMENKYLKIKNVSLLDKLLDCGSMNQKEIDNLFYNAGISPDSYFMLAVFNISEPDVREKTLDRAEVLIGLSRILQKHISTVFDQLGMSSIYKVSLSSVDYLIYADTEEELLKIAESLKSIILNVNAGYSEYDICLSFSSTIKNSREILKGLNEAYFTAGLLIKKLFPENVKRFSEIGSYQMLFYIEDKEQLRDFRDQYLEKLYEVDKESSSQLMETLHEYLVQSGNMLQTSKLLYIHRNTLQYRLERIQAITGKDLNDFKVRRDFINAFLIHDLIPYE